MKVIVLGTRGFPNVQGGVETHCENLYPLLSLVGCDVTVFTRAQYMTSDIKCYHGVNLIALSCPKNKFLEALFHTLKGVIKAWKKRPNILHIHANGPSLCVPIAKLLGMKVVMTSHGPEHMREKWKGFPKYILLLGEWCGVMWADAVISVSKENTRRICERRKANVYTIANGVNIPKILSSGETLKKFKLDKGKYLLAVGRFVPEKGFLDLIEAFDLLNKRESAKNLKGLKLVIVGRANHEDNYSRKLEKRGHNHADIVLTGYLSGQPLAELYSNAGLFVLPSYYEGLPIVLLEAMSYGLSCIASSISANKELPLHDSRFFKAGDIGEIADKIQEFMNNVFDEEQKAKQVSLIRKQYDWNEIAKRVLAVYHCAGSFGVMQPALPEEVQNV